MKISIDFDGTYTRDPELWDDFIRRAKDRGHEVICVTNRAFISEASRLPSVSVLCAGDNYKQAFAAENGHRVDVWIDDMPGTISPSLELP